MINITIDDKAIKRMLQTMPKTAIRAAEHALDQTAYAIHKEITATLPKVFNSPTPYTKRSLRYTKTRNHNMTASVWFREPGTAEHYLVPQVEGTERHLKSSEKALYKQKFVPSRSLQLDRYGNVSWGVWKQILSVLGRAEMTAGYQANVTKKSARRNTKQRDYIFLPRGSKSGKLPPGIYRRVAVAGKTVDAKVSRRFGLLGAKTYQYGRSKGKFQSITRARGLQPVLIKGRQHAKTTPRLPFYTIAGKVYDDKFESLFYAKLNQLVAR